MRNDTGSDACDERRNETRHETVEQGEKYDQARGDENGKRTMLKRDGKGTITRQEGSVNETRKERDRADKLWRAVGTCRPVSVQPREGWASERCREEDRKC